MLDVLLALVAAILIWWILAYAGAPVILAVVLAVLVFVVVVGGFPAYRRRGRL